MDWWFWGAIAGGALAAVLAGFLTAGKVSRLRGRSKRKKREKDAEIANGLSDIVLRGTAVAAAIYSFRSHGEKGGQPDKRVSSYPLYWMLPPPWREICWVIEGFSSKAYIDHVDLFDSSGDFVVIDNNTTPTDGDIHFDYAGWGKPNMIGIIQSVLIAYVINKNLDVSDLPNSKWLVGIIEHFDDRSRLSNEFKYYMNTVVQYMLNSRIETDNGSIRQGETLNSKKIAMNICMNIAISSEFTDKDQELVVRVIVPIMLQMSDDGKIISDAEIFVVEQEYVVFRLMIIRSNLNPHWKYHDIRKLLQKFPWMDQQFYKAGLVEAAPEVRDV